MDTPLQVIDAFIDGERVESAALKAALAEEAGRDYFVDLWLMREAVQRDAAAESTALPVAVVASRRTQPRWLVAAAIAAGLIGGYALGYRTPFRAAPPPGATPTIAVSTPVTSTPPSTAFPVPAPTRVIQLDFHPASTAGGD